jgi:hypothetical protein
MENLTIEKIANYIIKNNEIETANFINNNANKIYYASYSSGTYGKIFLNFIKNTYPLNLNFNGTLTSLAIEITRQMENLGYNFICKNNIVNFNK